MFAQVEWANLGRAQLLGDIANYLLRNPQESPLVERFQQFVRTTPNCFERSQALGHITASAFVLSIDGQRALLMHHRKLDRWLQPGGHADGSVDTLDVARKELLEEAGLSAVRCNTQIFDLDIHAIPAGKLDAKHLHFDVRYLMHATDETVAGNDESHALRWFDLSELAESAESSIRRMAQKALSR